MTWQSSRNSLNSTRAGRFRGISPFNTRGVGNPVPFSWNPFRFRYVIAMFYAEFPHVDCKISAKIGWSNWSCRVFKPPLMVTPYFLIKSLNPMSVHVGGETAPRKVVKSQLLMVENPPFFHETHWCFACEILHIWWALPIRTALWSNIHRCLPRSQTPREDLAGKRPGEWGVLGSGGSSGSSTKLYIDGPFRDTGLRWPKMVEDGLSPNVWPAN